MAEPVPHFDARLVEEFREWLRRKGRSPVALSIMPDHTNSSAEFVWAEATMLLDLADRALAAPDVVDEEWIIAAEQARVEHYLLSRMLFSESSPENQFLGPYRAGLLRSVIEDLRAGVHRES